MRLSGGRNQRLTVSGKPVNPIPDVICTMLTRQGKLACRGPIDVSSEIYRDAVLFALLPPFSFLLFAETLAICAGRHMQLSAEDSTQGFRIVHPYASSNLSLGQA
jgi:hypothetical protein